MKNAPFFLQIILVIALISTNACASLDPQLTARLNKVIEPQIGTLNMGAVIGIYDKGNIKYLSYGQMSLEKTQQPGKDTLFEIASISKTFTALMFSIAIDLGLVNAETTLAEIRPEWQNQKLGKITLLELATHRSGLARLPCDFSFLDDSNPYANYTEQQLILSITDKVIRTKSDKCKLSERPSLLINYSNWGAALLGHAISVRAKMSYAEILRKWITEPLSMKDTIVDFNPEQKSRLAQGYNENGDPTGLWYHLGMQGNGAISSTPTDMMIYAQAMIYPQTTSLANAIKRVQAFQYRDTTHSIAMNWYVPQAGSLFHNGTSGGFASMILINVHKELAVFYLTNTANQLQCIIEAFANVPCQLELP